jgi:hypothetical protein
MTEPAFVPELSPQPPSAAPDVLSRALQAGKWGALGGATLGGIRGAIKGKDFLKNTLGGAILGALGTGGFTAYHHASPFQRGGIAGTAYQEAMQRALGEAVGGAPLSDIGSSAIQQALMSVLAGKGQFTPDQQRALVQQFTQSIIPTEKGWSRRINLAERVANQLKAGKPHRAVRGLQTMAQVIPDMDMRTAAQHALQRIKSGRFRLPEERAALAALGERMRTRLDLLRKAQPAVSALAQMKSRYGLGELSTEELAQQIGLLTGRFGAQHEKAQLMRQLLQDMISRPVQKTSPGSLIGRTMEESPELGATVMEALGR